MACSDQQKTLDRKNAAQRSFLRQYENNKEQFIDMAEAVYDEKKSPYGGKPPLDPCVKTLHKYFQSNKTYTDYVDDNLAGVKAHRIEASSVALARFILCEHFF